MNVQEPQVKEMPAFVVTEGSKSVRYKLTEVGIIPEEWEVVPIKDLGTVIRGASPRPKGDRRYYGGNVPRLMVEDVTRDGKYVTPTVDFLTEEGAKLSRPCPAGTLTIVCSGTVGIPSFLAVDACIHDGFLAIINLKKGIDADYLYHSLKSQQSRFDNSATHGGVFTNLTTEIFRNFRIALPPKIEEQQAIAEALSDVDALIASQERLIAKQRAIKTATMQQLLSGKQRLPGFSGEWKVKTLESFSSFISKGATPTTYGFRWENSGMLFLRSECISPEGLELTQAMFISPSAHLALKRGEVQAGDIVMTITGNVGRVVLLPDNFGVANTNQHIARIRVTSADVSPSFVYHFLSQAEVRHNYNLITTGQAYPQLSLVQVRETQIPLPDIEEQRAIANVLSDMDAQITTLEAQRDKTKAIKQGMMQQLLTGRIRL